MRNNRVTMDSTAKNKGVRIKVEPSSPNQKSNASQGASVQASRVPFKNEFGSRLASFRPPRDLTLSAGTNHLTSLKVMGQPSANKKVFVPNLNVTRRRGGGNQNSCDVKPVIPIRPNIDKQRRQPRSKGNFVQTQGVFSDGLAPGKPREYSRSGGSAPQTTLEKPKLNLNRKINKGNEDNCMKSLLKDDFIDDPSILPDFNSCPKGLPVLLNAKPSSSKDIDSTFENLQVKTEKIENITAENLMSTNSELELIFEDSPDPRLIVFDFPEEIVKLEDKRVSKQEKTDKPPSNDNTQAKTEATHRLSNAGEGFWGSLRLLEDGTAYILAGQERIPVTLTRHCPKQNIMSVHLDTTARRGEIINLGKVSATLKCSTDLAFAYGTK